MIKTSVLTPENFDALLEWLSPDREQAGDSYEEIRRGLIRFFRFRGCADSHILADETINRVAGKLSTFDFSANVKKISFFYGFASKIYLEYVTQVGRREVQLDTEIQAEPIELKFVEETGQGNFDCLEKCLAELPVEESRLVLQYYSEDKTAKLQARKKLAETLNVKPNTLHTKIHRIKIVLKDCVEHCLQEN